LEIREGLPFEVMLDFYTDTKGILNEAISFEVNFRLFEGASCGVLVFTPDAGEDQDVCFTSGKEMLVYHNGLELLDQTAWAEAHPEQAERMGRAAWERIQAEHLPNHRVAALEKLIPDLSRSRATGEKARRLFWMSAMQLIRKGAVFWSVPDLFIQARDLEPHPELAAAEIRVLAEKRKLEEMLSLARDLLVNNLFPDSLDCNMSASAAAARLGDFTTAKQFWRRHVLMHTSSVPPEDPVSPYELCLFWSDVLCKAGRAAQPGFPFSPEVGHVPEVAFEFLRLTDYLDGKELSGVRKAEALCAQLPGYVVFRLGYLAILCLAEPDNWRMQLQYGLCSLRACRVEEGLFEVREARKKALAQGKDAVFLRMLAAAPGGEYIERALAASGISRV
jgi:hypothetical protein